MSQTPFNRASSTSSSNKIAPTTHTAAQEAGDGVVVLFPGGHGTPQLRPFPYTSRWGTSPPGTPAGEQLHYARRRHPSAGPRRRREAQIMARDFEHQPVMLAEVVETFADVRAPVGMGPGLIIDATTGGAGHAAAILEANPTIELLGLDQDPTAVAVARERLARFGHRAEVRRASFDALPDILDVDPRPLVGVLFDLGVSSHQLDVPERGFSHRSPGPLDMRMDPDAELTAATVVNDYDEYELRSLLRRYADERHAARIASAIVAHRPLLDTAHLAHVVKEAVPAAVRRKGRHPAMRTFQAVRIEVNRELDVIEPTLQGVVDRLEPGGRVAVLSYHSGEDRIVKHVLRVAADGACDCPSGLPCICGAGPTVRLLRRKVSRPTEAEVLENPRAASARFRAAERLNFSEN
jgi:16S rRNA (cytosine1402-N4)-methyltransferase